MITFSVVAAGCGGSDGGLDVGVSSVQKACELPAVRPLVVDNLPRDSIDTEAFIDLAVADLGDDYMGYSVLLIGRAGTLIGRAKYGYARTRCEVGGERLFNHETQTAWGSVTKVLTTALVIDKVERSSRNLNDLMWTTLPEDWRDEVDAANSPHRIVRIRDLLSHKSGFSGSNSRTLRERVAGPLEKSLASRVYSNANFAIFQHMGRFFRQGYFDGLEAGFVSSEIDKDSYLETVSVSIYKKALRDRIADKLQIAFSCNEPQHAGSNYALFYNNADSKEGYLLNPVDKPGCTTGGIVMSPKHMAKFLRALTRTDEIISENNYQNEMAITSDSRLGWDYAAFVTGGRMYGKNGARNFNGGNYIVGNPPGSARAEIVAFPNGTSALIVANSKAPSNVPSFRTILEDAYDATVSP